MTPGAIIAIAFWGGFLAVCAYGLSYDLRRWVDERLWRRDEQQALAKLRDHYEHAPADAGEERAVAGFCSWLGAMAEQAQEIADLPEVEPQRRWIA